MMEKITISEFLDNESGLKFNGASVFISDNKCLLFENNGHIILLNKKYLQAFYNKKIPKELIRKLTNRGFLSDINIMFGRGIYKCNVKPEFFMIDLTNRCNMRCKYCLRNINAENQSISNNVLKDICRFIQDYCEKEQLAHVSIQPWGGEPLLQVESIIEMKQLIKPQCTKVHFSIETNGVLLSEKMIELLHTNKIGIGISIDGTESAHNAQRVFADGQGTHAIVEKNLLLAQKRYGEKVGTITTITRKNAADIEEILEYYATKLKLTSVKFNFVHKSQFINCDNLCLTNEEIAEIELRLLAKLVDLNERGYYIKEHNIVTKLKNIVFNQYSDICLSKGCCGGKKMIVFDMKGNYYPCELTDLIEENIGNIYENDNLIETVTKALSNNKFFITKKEDKCQECEWYTYCGGGCTVRTMNVGKNPPQIDEIECAVNMALYPALIELILQKPFVVNILLDCEVL